MTRAGRRLAFLATAAWALLAAALPSYSATAGDLCDPVSPVFLGDPCNPATGPLPMLPGLPLVLPVKGPTGRWSEGAPSVATNLTGDVDLAVRVGTFPGVTEVTPPAGSANNPTLSQRVAGGGGNGQGSAVPFTVFVTDGPGTFVYGSPLLGLDQRPVAIFGYADLDGDGTIGPTDTDGTSDNEIERQEALGHVGRQVGQIVGDRFSSQVAVRLGAPASMGGLRVAFVAGMYTGDDPGQLWTNGTPIFTNWPFFPPLDPLAIVYLAEANPPDSNGPNIVLYQTSEFLLTDPSYPDLAEAFALRTDGSNPSTDQFVSVSGPAVGLRFFRNLAAASFTASSRLVARPAPTVVGVGRTLVTPAGEVAVTTGQNVELRLLPVDSLGNIADPDTSGVATRIRAEGGLRILSPDLDGDPFAETLTVDSAHGVVLQVGTFGVVGRARVTLYDPPPAVPVGLDQVLVFASATTAPVDSDDDDIADDGDDSGTIGDGPCTADDIAGSVPCDDNCPNVVNPSQVDSDGDGQGNCCDGACVINDGVAGCSECPQSASRFHGSSRGTKLAVRPRAGITPDAVNLRAVLQIQEGQTIDPAAEKVEVSIADGDHLHYFVQLPGLFRLNSSAPSWVYADPSGSVGGITRALLRATKRGVKARFLARGLDLVTTVPADPLPNGLVVSVTIGDDTFTRHVRCNSTLANVRCSSSN